MAWYSDEEYLFRQDCIDKKITARSARNTRTHNGKRGAVKFPSDFMSRKELKAMNGACVSYRMNSPISWEEFKTWPDEHKVTYVKLLREKFNVPNTALAEMFNVSSPMLCKYFKCWGLSQGNPVKRTWDKEGFLAWRSGAKSDVVSSSETPVEEVTVVTDETPVEEVPVVTDEIPVEEVAVVTDEETDGSNIDDILDICNKIVTRPIIPVMGEMTFEGSVNNILRAVNSILGEGNVRLTVKWETR